MIAVDLTLTLPDALAREAEEAGLLTSEGVQALLQRELRRRRVDHLFAAADRLAALNMAPMTEDEVQAEIEAARAEKRAAGAGRR